MDIQRLTRLSECAWQIEPHGNMQVPAILYGDEKLIHAMDDKVYEQASNVATLPGIVGPSYAMPDAHWGYGFPIGGVAAFDADTEGVVSAGGVGFDISCGVRTLRTGLQRADVTGKTEQLADVLFREIPVGVGSTGHIHLSKSGMDAMLSGGARWAVESGYGTQRDLSYTEEKGCMAGALPKAVSDRAKERQRKEMGTLGSGNHYLELQEVMQIYDGRAAACFGIKQGDLLVSIHCGSRGLGHQIGTEFLAEMVNSASHYGIKLVDRELACAPIHSPVGERYLGAMRAAINCALANRQIITHLTRQVFAGLLPQAGLELLYDVSHNTCKLEKHTVDGKSKRLYVHRKGATRAFGPGHSELPEPFRGVGQPVLIGGSMGTASYILAGNAGSEALSYASACHGAGRSMSRHKATKSWHGRQVINTLAEQGIALRSPSLRGVAEEAPGAYKDINAVVEATELAGLSRRVAKLEPVLCIKG